MKNIFVIVLLFVSISVFAISPLNTFLLQYKNNNTLVKILTNQSPYNFSAHVGYIINVYDDCIIFKFSQSKQEIIINTQNIVSIQEY